MVATHSGVLNRHRGFQNIVLLNPVFTVENSADNNPLHTTHSESVHTTCMVSDLLLQPNLRNSEGLLGQCQTLIGSERVPVQKNRETDPHYNLLSITVRLYNLLLNN